MCRTDGDAGTRIELHIRDAASPPREEAGSAQCRRLQSAFTQDAANTPPGEFFLFCFFYDFPDAAQNELRLVSDVCEIQGFK